MRSLWSPRHHRALHDRSADQRAIGRCIDQAPVQVGHFQHRRSHPMAFVRHHAEPASPGERWWDRLHHVVRRDRERYHLVDDRRGPGDRDVSSCTWMAGRVPPARRRRPAPAPFSIYRWGWGFSTLAGLQRRHRAHRVLRLILHPGHDPPVARRSVRLPAPLERDACAHGECATRHAPRTGTGVVTFLMGSVEAPLAVA